jgi:hypothetical protein
VYGPLVGFYEQSNESPGSIEGREATDSLSSHTFRVRFFTVNVITEACLSGGFVSDSHTKHVVLFIFYLLSIQTIIVGLNDESALSFLADSYSVLQSFLLRQISASMDKEGCSCVVFFTEYFQNLLTMDVFNEYQELS